MSRLNDDELVVLLELIEDEPEARYVEKLVTAAADGSSLAAHLARLQEVRSRGDARTRCGLLTALTLHAVAVDDGSLIPDAASLHPDEVNAVLAGIEKYRSSGEPYTWV